MDIENVELIIKGDTSTSAEVLEKFMLNIEGLTLFPELDESGLRHALWNSLYNLIVSSNNEQVQATCFSIIRILSRDKKFLDDLVKERDWLQLIKKFTKLDDPGYKFTEENKLVAFEAGKSLCNIVFNSRFAAKKCWTSGILNNINDRLKQNKDPSFPREIIHFDVKVMFIITALCPETRKPLRDEKLAVLNLMEIVDHIISESNKLGKVTPLDDDTVDLVCGVLRTLFNLTVHITDEKDVEQCRELVRLLRKNLLIEVSSVRKRNIVRNDVINLLTNMPETCYLELIGPLNGDETECKMNYCGRDMSVFAIILEVLQDNIEGDPRMADQLQVISPSVTVLFKAARSDRIIRKYLRSEILPPLRDVYTRPEHGTTLRNCLCRLLTTPITQLRDLVAEFLFYLCKKSVKRMIKYTGYGNAAGLFANRGLLGGREDKEAVEFSSDEEDSETEEYAEYKRDINPVLGCYETPRANPMEGMTDEQKEYEAMKLVELMDNLCKSGSIKPCRVGRDGKPVPIEHVLQLQSSRLPDYDSD